MAEHLYQDLEPAPMIHTDLLENETVSLSVIQSLTEK